MTAVENFQLHELLGKYIEEVKPLIKALQPYPETKEQYRNLLMMQREVAIAEEIRECLVYDFPSPEEYETFVMVNKKEF